MRRIGAVLAGVLAILLVASVASAVVGAGSGTSDGLNAVASDDGGRTVATVGAGSAAVVPAGLTERIRSGEAERVPLMTDETETTRERARVAFEQQVRAMDQDGTCTGDCAGVERNREQARSEQHGTEAREHGVGDCDCDGVAAHESEACGDCAQVVDQIRDRDRVAAHEPTGDRDGFDGGEHHGDGHHSDHD